MNDTRNTFVYLSIFATVFFVLIALHILLRTTGPNNELILLGCAACVPLLQLSWYDVSRPAILVAGCLFVSFSTVLIDWYYPDVFDRAFCGPISFATTFGFTYLMFGTTDRNAG